MDYVIAKTNVDPHFVTPNDEQMIADMEKLAWHQEEPFGSASIYVQYCVMQLAKQNDVTVLLDGQGADEILAGYHPYYMHYFNELRDKNKKLYESELLAYKNMHEGSEINESVLTGWKNIVKSFVPDSATLLRRLYQQYKQLKDPLLSKEFHSTYFKESYERVYDFETLNHSLYKSTMVNGLQELLRYADRNSMAHSREVRLPFLNHEFVEFLFTLPSEYKIKEGWTKWIMREATTSILPKEIGWRKDKIGYEPPQKSWMENAKMKDKIISAKENLINKGIVSPRLKDKPLDTSMEWKFFVLNEVVY
jgi:asparagine synthase (glutamine-hydrolysing)